MRSIVPCERLRCTGACLDDFEEVIFLRRKIVEGLPPEICSLWSALPFVAPLQNGVEAPSQLAAVLGAEHVLGGLCGTFSWVVGPGRIRSISAASGFG